MTIPSLATTLHRVFSSFSRKPPQISLPSSKATDMPVTQAFDPTIAQAEGWDSTWRWRQPDPFEPTEAWLNRTARQRAEIVAAVSR